VDTLLSQCAIIVQDNAALMLPTTRRNTLKTLHVELKTETDVNVAIAAILEQIMDKLNYEMAVTAVIHFEEIDPQDIGYVVGTMHFHPWGADAFECMEESIRRVVSPDHMSIALTVENMQSTQEEDVHEAFNRTFNKLDDCRSAGTVYVGGNGGYILRYLDVNSAERDVIWNDLKDEFAENHCLRKTTDGNNLDVEIC
jgi:hypothetical protein